MELEADVLERVRRYESLSRWERSELGQALRRRGLSYGEIMDLIPVKKSTLATWCRGIPLTKEQIEGIKRRRAPEPGIPRDTQRKRRREVELIRAQARLEAEHLVEDPLWVAGVVLYWAEGSKTQGQLRMGNSDPAVLRLFVKWVRHHIDPRARFSMQLHLHEGNDEAAAQRHWRQAIGLADANFYRTFVKPSGTGHRKNHLEHGVCSVKMRRCTDAWYRTMEWIETLSGHLGVAADDG